MTDPSTPLSRLEAVLAESRQFPSIHTVMVGDDDLRWLLTALEEAVKEATAPRWEYPREQRAFDAGCLRGIAEVPGLPDDRREALRSIAGRLFDPGAHCRKCGAPMAPGKALENNLSGSGDFGRDDVVTMSPDGTARLVDCMKCTACGWSVTR